MEEVQLYVGLKLTEHDEKCGNSDWRIISVCDGICRLVKLETTRLTINSYLISDLFELIHTGKFSSDYNEVLPVVDISKLPSKEIEWYKLRKSFVTEVAKEYGPSFVEFCRISRKESFHKICARFQIDKTTGYRYLRQWFQGGLIDSALVNPIVLHGSSKIRSYSKKTGKENPISNVIVDERITSQFDYGVELFRKNRLESIKDAYAAMISRFYSTQDGDKIVLLPPEERPTERQFRYYLHKKMTPMEI